VINMGGKHHSIRDEWKAGESLSSEPGIPRVHVLNNLVAYRADLVARLEAVDKRIKILKSPLEAE